MTEQLSLLTPRARASDPQTSKDAAARMATASSGLEAQILESLRFRSMTDDAICTVLNITPRRWPSCKTARSRLYKAGKVVWTGETRGNQRVWALKENHSTGWARDVQVSGDVL